MTQPAVPPSLCTISPGWALIHKVEADASLTDKFTRQTCVVRTVADHVCSMFIPAGVKPTENKVHIFFAANGVEGDVSNAVTCHAFRAAAASTDWILISVAGISGGSDTVTASEVLDFLDRHGRPRRVDKLRLSCHSRGKSGLAASLQPANKLVAKTATGAVFAGSIVERVVTFDADENNNLTPSVAAAGISASALFGYQVVAQDWHIKQTIKVRGFAHSTKCLQAVIYCRLIEDAKTLQPALAIPADIDAMVTSLALPALGLLTSEKSPAAPKVNYQDFCVSKTPLITAKSFDTGKLFNFVHTHDLARLSQPALGDGVYQHHFFVAEFAHEVTDATPPTPTP